MFFSVSFEIQYKIKQRGGGAIACKLLDKHSKKIGAFINPKIENTYTYHAPKTEQIEIYKQIREKGKEFAELIDRCPR